MGAPNPPCLGGRDTGGLTTEPFGQMGEHACITQSATAYVVVEEAVDIVGGTSFVQEVRRGLPAAGAGSRIGGARHPRNCDRPVRGPQGGRVDGSAVGYAKAWRPVLSAPRTVAERTFQRTSDAAHVFEGRSGALSNRRQLSISCGLPLGGASPHEMGDFRKPAPLARLGASTPNLQAETGSSPRCQAQGSFSLGRMLQPASAVASRRSAFHDLGQRSRSFCWVRCSAAASWPATNAETTEISSPDARERPPT